MKLKGEKRAERVSNLGSRRPKMDSAKKAAGGQGKGEAKKRSGCGEVGVKVASSKGKWGKKRITGERKGWTW